MSWGRSSVLLFSSIICSSGVSAAPWQVKPFIQSLEGSVYDFEFLVEGLKSVGAIRFTKEATIKYQGMINRMVLGVSVDDGAHRIPELSKIQSEDLGDIAHESFHAFKANFIDVDPKFLALKLWMKSRARVVYGSLSQQKAEVALEEAYAVFIGSMVSSRARIPELLSHGPTEKCADRKRVAEHLWAIDWASVINGYYYRTGLEYVGYYWGQNFKKFWGLVSKPDRPRDSGREDDSIVPDESITILDKEWIANRLLQERVSPSFVKTFEAEKSFIACSAVPNLP